MTYPQAPMPPGFRPTPRRAELLGWAIASLVTSVLAVALSGVLWNLARETGKAPQVEGLLSVSIAMIAVMAAAAAITFAILAICLTHSGDTPRVARRMIVSVSIVVLVLTLALPFLLLGLPAVVG